MNSKPAYLQGFAVIRIDDGAINHESHVNEFVVNGTVLPALGPSNVRVKEVVTTAEEARREVIRLNALNADKGCKYYWQATHIFLEGGSHGSVRQLESESETKQST